MNIEIPKILIPVVATPSLQAVLNLIGLLNLPPMGHWGWSANILIPVTYFVAAGAAAIAHLAVPSTNSRKSIAIAGGMTALLVSLGVYTWVSNSPPQQGWLVVHDIVGYVSFFGTYCAYGYLVGSVTGVFTSEKRE